RAAGVSPSFPTRRSSDLERVAQGLRCTGVPTSQASADLARELGIPIGPMSGPLDLAFDGADAVDPRGLVEKGAGGAHVRERVVRSEEHTSELQSRENLVC